MTVIDAKGLHFSELGDQLRAIAGQGPVQLINCLGHRYIGAGVAGLQLEIAGIPGNALGAYLGEGSEITVRGNAQDATGDTMSGGTITIHGSTGDAAGYGMRGGVILVKGNAGYRAGIHMKEFGDKCPSMVIGGRAGDFLGEYQAGGNIVVLGLDAPESAQAGRQSGIDPQQVVGRFCGTGQHGGRIYLRTEQLPRELPLQVSHRVAAPEDIDVIRPLLVQYANAFGADLALLTNSTYLLMSPNSANPYKSMYAQY